jgi:hypothetical protein
MSQVLEAPEIRNDKHTRTADSSKYLISRSHKREVGFRRSVTAIFTKPKPEHIPEYTALTEEQEGTLDRIC